MRKALQAQEGVARLRTALLGWVCSTAGAAHGVGRAGMARRATVPLADQPTSPKLSQGKSWLEKKRHCLFLIQMHFISGICITVVTRDPNQTGALLC